MFLYSLSLSFSENLCREMKILLHEQVWLQKPPRGSEADSYLWLLLLPSYNNLFLQQGWFYPLKQFQDRNCFSTFWKLVGEGVAICFLSFLNTDTQANFVTTSGPYFDYMPPLEVRTIAENWKGHLCFMLFYTKKPKEKAACCRKYRLHLSP